MYSCEITLRWIWQDATEGQSLWVSVMLDAIRQRAISCVNIDQDLCRKKTSSAHNELMFRSIY